MSNSFEGIQGWVDNIEGDRNYRVHVFHEMLTDKKDIMFDETLRKYIKTTDTLPFENNWINGSDYEYSESEAFDVKQIEFHYKNYFFWAAWYVYPDKTTFGTAGVSGDSYIVAKEFNDCDREMCTDWLNKLKYEISFKIG